MDASRDYIFIKIEAQMGGWPCDIPGPMGAGGRAQTYTTEGLATKTS